jgi:hypothetical protein
MLTYYHRSNSYGLQGRSSLFIPGSRGGGRYESAWQTAVPFDRGSKPTVSQSCSYETGTIPSALIREARVVGFISRSWAAPPVPETLPCAALSAPRILSASICRIWASVSTTRSVAATSVKREVGVGVVAEHRQRPTYSLRWRRCCKNLPIAAIEECPSSDQRGQVANLPAGEARCST